MIRYKCILCANEAAEKHEPFFGANDRKWCIDNDLCVPVCRDCHDKAHGKTISQDYNKNYKIDYQKKICVALGLKVDIIKKACYNRLNIDLDTKKQIVDIIKKCEI